MTEGMREKDEERMDGTSGGTELDSQERCQNGVGEEGEQSETRSEGWAVIMWRRGRLSADWPVAALILIGWLTFGPTCSVYISEGQYSEGQNNMA